jgi:hypothetical protein
VLPEVECGDPQETQERGEGCVQYEIFKRKEDRLVHLTQHPREVPGGLCSSLESAGGWGLSEPLLPIAQPGSALLTWATKKSPRAWIRH